MGTPVSSGNRGVLALGSSLAGLFLTENPLAEVTLLTSNNQPTTFEVRTGSALHILSVVNYRLSPRSAPNQHIFSIVLAAICYRLIPVDAVRGFIANCFPFILTVREAHIVGDVRGGDSFSDIYGLKRFALAFLPSFAVLLIRGSMVHFPQTYGPFKNRVTRVLARFLLLRSSTLIARDTGSLKVADQLLSGIKEIKLTPDVAFSLPPIVPSFPKLSIPVQNTEELRSLKAIGINVNGLMYYGGYSRNNMFGLKMRYCDFLYELSLKLLELTDRDILLVPHTFAAPGHTESDNHACVQLRGRLPAKLQARVRTVEEEYDQYEIKGLIGLCDFFVGSRMHSCIAALSQGVPCVGVAYSMKFQGVFETVKMGDWVIDGRARDNPFAISKILKLYQGRERSRQPLLENATAAKHKLHSAFSKMVAAASRS